MHWQKFCDELKGPCEENETEADESQPSRRVPTIYVVFGSFCQECFSNFAINVLLLQNATITEQNMRVDILETGGMAKPEKLIMYKTILNRV